MPHPFDSVKFLQSWKINKMNSCIEWWITTSTGYFCSSSQKVWDIPFFPNYATAVSSPTSKKPNCYSGMLHVSLTARLTWSLMWQSQGGRRCNMGSMKQKSMHPSKWIYCQMFGGNNNSNSNNQQTTTTELPTTNQQTNRTHKKTSNKKQQTPPQLPTMICPFSPSPKKNNRDTWFVDLFQLVASHDSRWFRESVVQNLLGIFVHPSLDSCWRAVFGGWGLGDEGWGLGLAIFLGIHLISWDGKYELYLETLDHRSIKRGRHNPYKREKMMGSHRYWALQ